MLLKSPIKKSKKSRKKPRKKTRLKLPKKPRKSRKLKKKEGIEKSKSAVTERYSFFYEFLFIYLMNYSINLARDMRISKIFFVILMKRMIWKRIKITLWYKNVG